jgi:hypothetical protein
MTAQSIKIGILFIVTRATTIEVAQKLQYVKEEKRERGKKNLDRTRIHLLDGSQYIGG